ncbi:MAG TPA: hypothetical protein PLA01_08835, partial [Acetivibrio sp.]|nr:hypothetical protein [Acetivibrio sp.]
MFEKLAARGIKTTPEAVLKSSFASVLKEQWINDAMFLDTALNRVIGVANLPFKAPAVLQLLKNRDVAAYLIELAGDDSSVMVIKEENGVKVF